MLNPPLIRPFKALRPGPEYAAAIAAPPYDVLSSEEARVRAKDKPYSFLHVSKAEIDLPESVSPYAPQVYAKSAENFRKMIAENILVREKEACYYAYRLTMGAHTQTGLIALASVDAYNTARIKKHEFTRPDKEDDRVRQIEALNAQTGPALLAAPDSQALEALLAEATTQSPIADLVADDGIVHTVWRISDAAAIEKITAIVNGMESLYIADGHHRSAAASRVAAARQGQAADASQYFLSVIFTARQLRILDYNRVVRDLNGHTVESFLSALSAYCTVTRVEAAYSPKTRGHFGMYLDQQWYALEMKAACIPVADPVGRLDVSVLSDTILGPILGITDLRRDTRIDFVGGIRGVGELEKRVNSGEMKLAFSLCPTALAELIAVADAGEIMPPKSTWFEPKLADGLASHILD